jgi:hypothetical protein
MTVSFIVYVPGVVANIMTESSHCFCKCDTNSGCRSLYNSLPKFGLVIIYLCKPTVGSWWSQWGVMAARQWYSSWRWWFDTLWVTLIRLWSHSFLVCWFWYFVELTWQLPLDYYCGLFLAVSEIIFISCDVWMFCAADMRLIWQYGWWYITKASTWGWFAGP